MGQGRGLGLAVAFAASCGKIGFDPIADADLAADSHNCGRTGHDCLGGACVAGACQPWTLATGEPNPWHLACDSARVYWTNDIAPGSIRACPLAGCTGAPASIASMATGYTRIAVDGGNLYFSEFDAGVVATCASTSCTPQPLASGENQPMGVAVIAGTLYWADSGGTTVRMLSPGATTPQTLASSAGGGPRTLAYDASTVFWTTSGGHIESCALNGCPSPTVLAPSEPSPYFIAVYGGDVYWGDSLDPGRVQRCPTSGCSPTGPQTIAATPFSNGIAVDATGIYWVAGDTTSGAVYFCPLAGCGPSGPTVLASGQSAPFGLAMTTAALYWTNPGDGTVRAIARP